MRRLPVCLSAAVALLIVHASSVATACTVCTAGRDEENATAFLLSTIFMSLLPLIAVGTLFFVVWRRYRRLETTAQPPQDPRRPQPLQRTPTAAPTR